MLQFALGAIVVYGLFLVAGLWLRPKLALHRHQARLRAMSVTDLALEARRCADSAGYLKQFPDARLFAQSEAWTSASLAEALDELYASASSADRLANEAGPGSFVYSWYDFGLASIREALEVTRPDS